MPARLEAQIGPGPSEKLRLTLTLDAGLAGELLAQLRELFEAPVGSELRLDLPRNWIVFWKKREGESRLLLAHPQAEEWVSTVALLDEHAKLLDRKARGLVSGRTLNLSELAATGSMSNLEVTLARV